MQDNEELTDETTQQNDNQVEEQTENVDREAQLEQELAQINDRYLRLYAEFDNYKRRTARERVELMQSAGKDVISSLLTVLDDFDRALKMMDSAQDIPAVKEGVDLISQKLRKTLQQQGLKEMEAEGNVFDPDFHEAITNIPAPTEELKGKVVDVVEKGYFLNDRVLRYAKVVVGN